VFHPQIALARRGDVLGKMRKLGMIDQKTYQAAVTAKLGLDVEEEQRYPAAHFVEYVKQWFLANQRFGSTYAERYDRLFSGGLRVYTTIDLALQRDAENAVNHILAYKSDPYGAMTVIDPRTGEIRAMVGGRDFFAKQKFARLNLATGGATGRQAGSSFKPFALITALERGISPQQRYPAPAHLDIPLPGYVPPVWSVGNYDGAEAARSMTLEQATINSVNTVFAQLIMQVGAANVVRTAQRMGITSRLHAYPSAVLGTSEVNTLEMASAYGTLATLGKHTPPIAVSRIEDATGRVIYRAAPHLDQVVNPGVAWTTDQILQKVILGGTGTAANIGRPAAGKTGTAQNWTNAWFVGFVPQLTAAVWVGFPQGQVSMASPRVRIPHVLGGTWPAQIWHSFMVNATRGMPVETFPKPTIRYVNVAVDAGRGCRPNLFTLPTEIRVVRYIDGTQPTEICTEPTGPQQVALPSVVGKTDQVGSEILKSYGFQVVLTGVAPGEPGTVVAQDPPAGSIALQGTVVTLTVRPAPSPSPSPSPSPAPSGSSSPSPSPSPTPSSMPDPSPTPTPGD